MFGGNAVDSAIKFYPRLGVYKASNVLFDPETMTATSYGWWVFLARIKGKIVFNDYSYSQSTNRHQSKVRKVLEDLGIKIDVIVNCRSDLRNLDEALKAKYEAIAAHEIVIASKAKPDTKTRSMELIQSLKADIKTLRSLGARFNREKQKDVKKKAIDSEIERLEGNRKERMDKQTDRPRISNDSFAKKSNHFELVV